MRGLMGKKMFINLLLKIFNATILCKHPKIVQIKNYFNHDPRTNIGPKVGSTLNKEIYGIKIYIKKTFLLRVTMFEFVVLLCKQPQIV